MKVTTEELAPCEVLLTIEFDPKKEEDLLKKAAKRIARQVRIPGFRPGKAPYNTVVRRFGLEAVQQEAMESMADKIIKDALDEANVEPFAQIELQDVSWNPLVLKLKIPTPPEVEISEYRDIRLDFEPVEVTDEDVEETLKRIQEQNATWTPVERPAQLGDLISMTVTEKDGDTVLTDNESVEYELKPVDEEENGSRPDLTTPLLGLSAGENKTFTITYPEDFNNKEYAGKEITVSVEVSGVKEKELDPLDDEFAQQVGDFDTLDELKEDIRQNLFQSREQQRDGKLGTEMLDKIVEAAPKVEWPLALEEEEIDAEISKTRSQLKQMGLTLDGYLQMQQKTEEEWREELRAAVQTRLKRGLVLSKVAEAEGLEVSQSEILQQAKILADYSGAGEQMWQYILSSQSQQNAIANDLIATKAIQRLAAIARGEAPEPGAEKEETPAETEAKEEPAPPAEPDAESGDETAATEAEAETTETA